MREGHEICVGGEQRGHLQAVSLAQTWESLLSLSQVALTLDAGLAEGLEYYASLS